MKNPQILHHPKQHAPDHNPQPKQDAPDCNSTGWASAPPPPSSSLTRRPPKTYKPYHQTSKTLGKPSNPTRQDQAHHRDVTINILVRALNSVLSMSPLAQGSQWQSSKRRVKDPATKPSQPAILELGYQRPGKRGCESEADAEQDGGAHCHWGPEGSGAAPGACCSHPPGGGTCSWAATLGPSK